MNVFGRGGIRLGRDPAAVGILAHGPGVRQLHPLNGIDVDPQIPVIHRIGMDTGQQSEVSGDHQTLDVMGIGVLQRLADGGSQAIHTCLAGPVKIGKSGLMVEIIHCCQIGHQGPVDAPHVFAPAQDLTHKTLNLLDF